MSSQIKHIRTYRSGKQTIAGSKIDSPAWYKHLYKDNQGIFYRGISNGKGLGIGMLGDGIYLTWSRKMAQAFSTISEEENRGKPELETYKVAPNLKLLDWQSNEMWRIRKKLGAMSPWETVTDRIFIRFLTYEVKKLGYDGVISDNLAEGMVIFDARNVNIIKKEAVI